MKTRTLNLSLGNPFSVAMSLLSLKAPQEIIPLFVLFVAVSAEWLSKWHEEIPYTLFEADFQIRKLLRFVERNTDYSLIVASSMGQAAVQESEKIENEVLITNVGRLMDFLGIRRDEWSPSLAMQPQVVVRCKSQASINLLKGVSKISVNSKFTEVKSIGDQHFKIQLGPNLANQESLSVKMNGETTDPELLGISLVHLQDAAGANAYHVPEGVLITYRHPVNADTETSKAGGWNKISTTDVAPSLLANFGVDRPSYMKSTDLFRF